MYGIINNSFKKYVQESYGQDCWTEVLAVAGVHDDVFIELMNHNDQNTIEIVKAAVGVTGDSMDHQLSNFGRFWIRRVALKNYRGLIDSYGGNFFSLLENLNLMHKEISSSFLNYLPPSISIEHVSEFDYRVIYQSHRQGFTPFVLGILEELGDVYSHTVVINCVETTSDESGETSVISLDVRPK